MILIYLPLHKVHSCPKIANEGVNIRSDAHTTKCCSAKRNVVFIHRSISTQILPKKQIPSTSDNGRTGKESYFKVGLVSELTDQRKKEKKRKNYACKSLRTLDSLFSDYTAKAGHKNSKKGDCHFLNIPSYRKTSFPV